MALVRLLSIFPEKVAEYFFGFLRKELFTTDILIRMPTNHFSVKIYPNNWRINAESNQEYL